MEARTKRQQRYEERRHYEAIQQQLALEAEEAGEEDDFDSYDDDSMSSGHSSSGGSSSFDRANIYDHNATERERPVMNDSDEDEPNPEDIIVNNHNGLGINEINKLMNAAPKQPTAIVSPVTSSELTEVIVVIRINCLKLEF